MDQWARLIQLCSSQSKRQGTQSRLKASMRRGLWQIISIQVIILRHDEMQKAKFPNSGAQTTSQKAKALILRRGISRPYINKRLNSGQYCQNVILLAILLIHLQDLTTSHQLELMVSAALLRISGRHIVSNLLLCMTNWSPRFLLLL